MMLLLLLPWYFVGVGLIAAVVTVDLVYVVVIFDLLQVHCGPLPK